jgi:hypothetical protein
MLCRPSGAVTWRRRALVNAATPGQWIVGGGDISFAVRCHYMAVDSSGQRCRADAVEDQRMGRQPARSVMKEGLSQKRKAMR